MLRGIHKASSTWLGKALMAGVMGVLVISFAIWGIGDIFRGFGQNAVAEIGGTEISIDQFRQYYSDRLQQMGRQMGRPISPDQARALGLDRQILGQLVAEKTLDEQARKMHLGLSDDAIAKRISADPSFLGLNGQFDRNRFEMLIRQAGYTEQRFVDEQRSVLLRRQLAQTVSGDLPVPTTALRAINQYQNERRDIDYLTLGAAQAGDIPAPAQDELAKYFDARKVLFRAPEYRKITVLTLSPDTLAKADEVSDADARAFYDQNKASFGKPEQRELRQIIFPNEADAAAARDRIAKGATFDDIAKERKLNASDTDLGMVTKAGMLDAAVADAAFALKSGDVSQPVKGQFGTVLLVVGKILPGEQKTYEEVAGQIKQQLAESRARSQINDLRDKVEDDRASGATLTETAKKFNLKAETIDAVDRSGRAPNGQQVPGLPSNVINAAFSSDIGVDNDAIQSPTGGYIYFDVNGITPSRDRTLAEVKDQVEARWRADEVAKRLQAKSDDLLGKLKAGTPLDQLATENGLKVQKASDLQRAKQTADTPANLINAVFTTAKGAVGSAANDTGDQRTIFRVTEVTSPAFDANSPDTKQLQTGLQNSYADDLIGAYIAQLESSYGVKINPTALNQVVGGQTQ
ncbi:MAG TPA: SurA N-terminal domain-containing protein [Pseudolabrys sp.]|nr:SurA N-terminal domain-containing protein [Pseudolabrys sp.]